MENVKAIPFIGENYGDGIFGIGCRVLLLGVGHYDSEHIGWPCHPKATLDVVNSFMEGENAPYFRGFTSLTNALANREVSNSERKKIWSHLAFYNFVQTNLAGPNSSPSAEEFHNSIPAFLEVLEHLNPDLIVPWGYPLYDKLYSLGVKDGPIVPMNERTKVATRWFGEGTLMLRHRNPARAYTWQDWGLVFDKLFHRW